MERSGPDGVNTMERSAIALEQFTRTMKTAEKTLAAAGTLIGDPRYQQQLQATMAALPELLNETRGTLQAVNQVIRQVNTTVGNINAATTPLAQQSQSMVNRLNRSLGNIEVISGELAVISKLMNQNDGTIRKLLTDPDVYRNLNSTSATLAILLQNLKPVIADMQISVTKSRGIQRFWACGEWCVAATGRKKRTSCRQPMKSSGYRPCMASLRSERPRSITSTKRLAASDASADRIVGDHGCVFPGNCR